MSAVARKDVWNRKLAVFRERARVDCERINLDCPGSWGALRQLTSTPSFSATINCPVCEREVVLCTREEDLILWASQGRCVAVLHEDELPDPSELPEEGLYSTVMYEEDDVYVPPVPDGYPPPQ